MAAQTFHRTDNVSRKTVKVGPETPPQLPGCGRPARLNRAPGFAGFARAEGRHALGLGGGLPHPLGIFWSGLGGSTSPSNPAHTTGVEVESPLLSPCRAGRGVRARARARRVRAWLSFFTGMGPPPEGSPACVSPVRGGEALLLLSGLTDRCGRSLP